MLIRNNKGVERSFEILFELEIKNNKYMVYRDPFTKNIYCGKRDDNKLKVLSDEEYKKIENILNRMNG